MMLLTLLTSTAALAGEIVVTGHIGGDIRSSAALMTLSGDTLVAQAMDRGRFTLTLSGAGAGMYRLKVGGWEKAYYLTEDTITVGGYVDRQTGQGDVTLKNIEAHKRLLDAARQVAAAAENYKHWVADTVATMPEARQGNAEIELLMREESVKATAAARMAATEADPGLAAAIAYMNAGSLYEDVSRVYDALPEAAKETAMGRQLKDKAGKLKASANGAIAPDFAVTDNEGRTVSLSDLRGKPVLVDFWASWCGPCRKEMAYLKQLYAELSGRGVAFVSISLDDRRQQWEKACGEEQIPWLSWWDSEGFNLSRVRQLYGFSFIPFCMVIDAEGRIVGKNLRRDGLREALEKIIK